MKKKKRLYSGEKKDEHSFPTVTHNLMILVTFQVRGLALTLHIHGRFSGDSGLGCHLQKRWVHRLGHRQFSQLGKNTAEHLTAAGQCANPEARCVPSVHSPQLCVILPHAQRQTRHTTGHLGMMKFTLDSGPYSRICLPGLTLHHSLDNQVYRVIGDCVSLRITNSLPSVTLPESQGDAMEEP